MVFSSTLFLLLFLPIFFISYYLTIKKYRNYVALLGSLLFYAWGGLAFLGPLLISLVVDWHLVNAISNHREDSKVSRFYLIIALIINVCLLGYFKYANFFVDNINSVLFRLGFEELRWLPVVLPIGISFIVFHKISYIIDIYRSEKKPTNKLSTYMLYILLFPMSIAGPIIKFQDISEQLEDRDTKFDDILYGLYRFSIGLFKKIWIADNIAIVADQVFSIPDGQLTFWYAWIGIVAYALQIYFDFSGYADMAIGLSRMTGFKVSENFRRPYLSQSITEFWRRWHISLSSWMRDYLYIPLGGNRRSIPRIYFNLWVVFIISGIWHGANWTFVFWGVLHGFFMICDKLFWLDISKRLPRVVNLLFTLFLILITWVFFRSETIGDAFRYILIMFDVSTITEINDKGYLNLSNSFITIFIISISTVFFPVKLFYERILGKYHHIIKSETFIMALVICTLLISIIKVVSSEYSPFIYFRF